MGFECLNLLWGSKIQKNGYRTLELDVPSCQSWKFWKNHVFWPPGSAFTCKSPYGAPTAINLGGNVSTSVFWPKTISFHLVMHIKATKTYGLFKKPSSKRCFVIWGHLGVAVRAQSDRLLVLGLFSKFEIFKEYLNNKISIWCVRHSFVTWNSRGSQKSKIWTTKVTK